MTDRLYYNDPYKQEFDATIVRAGVKDAHQVLLLDRSAFYPTSGGQPSDTGTLGATRVIDVFDDDDGNVWHAMEAGGSPLAAGQPVHGTIDWPRRFDHMQQHTGQHVLSAAFERIGRARTVSFHLGADLSTIDLARTVTPDEIREAENEANRVVWDDRPVTIRYVSEEEARQLPLRKEPARGGTLRLIDIEAFDLSACGGTHVARTGVIGLIAITGWERFKGGQRVTFACGGRALARHRLLRDAAAATGRLLSAVPADLPAAVERLQNDLRESRRSAQAMEIELAWHRAAALVASAVEGTNGRVVARVVEGDAAALKTLAAAVVATGGMIVALVSAASPPVVVVARSADVTASAKETVAVLLERFGGKGGGRDEMAQAGTLTAAPELIVETIRGLLGVKV
jgi:alanyl-tRNA synthetase